MVRSFQVSPGRLPIRYHELSDDRGTKKRAGRYRDRRQRGPTWDPARVPVQTLIDFLETGETIDDFLAVYPTIPQQHVFAFLELTRDIAIDQLVCASS